MEHYLAITTEVNGEKVIAHRKTFLEYPEEENHKCLFFEARKAASNITGIKETEIEEGKHFLWDYEEYDSEKHDQLNCVDLCEVYKPMFYSKDE